MFGSPVCSRVRLVNQCLRGLPACRKNMFTETFERFEVFACGLNCEEEPVDYHIKRSTSAITHLMGK